MKKSFLGFLLFTFFSCKNNSSQKPGEQSYTPSSSKKDSLSKKASISERDKPALLQVDTVLHISIDDVSLEGSEVTANYIQGILKNSRWEIYGETGKRLIIYTFSPSGKIQVNDKLYKYKKPMGEVKSDKDMVLDSVVYNLDTSGVLLSKIKDTDGIVETFLSFKQNVPLFLKK